MSNIPGDLYDRQKDLPLKIPEHVIVVGAGGVGSWVALGFALAGTRKLTIIDPDKVEESNRNRTLFKDSQVGMSKVAAIAELIAERRKGCDVTTMQRLAKDVPSFVAVASFKNAVCIDCRDAIDPLPEFFPPCPITGGYDGVMITMHRAPDLSHVLGDDNIQYTRTPSYLVPPMLIASMIIDEVLRGGVDKIEEVITFDVSRMLETLKSAMQEG
jgi:vacuolar-type H+-ATPase subunit F/Vma7